MFRRWKLRLLLSVAIGISIPLIQVWLACRDPMSEPCVWGKAFLRLSVPVHAVVVGGILFGVFTIVGIARDKRRDRERGQ